MVEQDYDPIREALRAFADTSPQGRFEVAQRAAFRRALLRDLLAEYDIQVPRELKGDPLITQLARLVALLRSNDPQRVEDLFVILHNAVLGLKDEARDAERVRASKRQTWTRHRIRQAGALQDAAREAIEREPTDDGARVRIAKDEPVGDGWSADGTLPLARIAQGPPGRGPAVSWHDERHQLMGYLTGPLGMPELHAADACESLLRIYLGVDIGAESLRRWWQRRESL